MYIYSAIADCSSSKLAAERGVKAALAHRKSLDCEADVLDGRGSWHRVIGLLHNVCGLDDDGPTSPVSY